MIPEITVLDRLLEVSQLLQKDMARAFADTPLTPSRTRVLWALAAFGPSAQHELAARLEMSPRNITALVDALEAGSYVVRAQHPNDRRAIIVSLTPSCVTLMRDMQRDHAELSTELLEAVNEHDREPLLRGVTAITARLQELIAAEEERAADAAQTEVRNEHRDQD